MTVFQKSVAAGALIVAYFLGLTHAGFTAWFSVDDLTNIQFLHGAGQRPFGLLLAHCLVVATPEYRPLGGVVYRALYAVFGLNALPFRIFCYTLLLVNLFLASLFFYRLARSRLTAALGTLIFAVHTCMGALYFNTGTLYDILCFSFGLSALIVYVAARQGGGLLPARNWIAFFVCFGLALDSKEMAITWPAVLLAYECIFHWREDRWPARLKPIALCAFLAILFSFVKTQVPNEMSITPQYIPRISVTYAGQQLLHYYSLILWNRSIGAAGLSICLALLLLLAAALRSRPMIFGFLFANIALLPLLVIPGRSGFVWYIPFAGWALYFGNLLSRLIDWASQQIAGARVRDSLACICFLFLLAALWMGQRNAASHMGDPLLPEEAYLKSLHHAVMQEKSACGSGSRILIENDPLGPVDWSQLFLIRLSCRDASIWVDRPSQMGGAFDAADLSAYSAIVHAGTPIRIQTGRPIAQESALGTTATPLTVNRNNEISLRIPGFRGCDLDAEYRRPDDELARSGLWKNWCRVGEDGRCTVRIGQDAERGIVQIRRVRLCGGDWRRTGASFEILP